VAIDVSFHFIPSLTIKYNMFIKAPAAYKQLLIPTFTEVYASPTFSSTDLYKPELLFSTSNTKSNHHNAVQSFVE
jgi:hypothetical protein